MESTSPFRNGRSSLIRVLVVDDHPWVRKGLLALLATEQEFEVCGEAEDAHGAIALVEARQPDLAIIDISLKGDMDGIELTKQLKASHRDLIILVLSLHAEAEYKARALEAGASAYLCKTGVNDFLFDTLRSIMAEVSPEN